MTIKAITRAILLLGFSCFMLSALSASQSQSGIDWKNWQSQNFVQAKQQGKLLLLDLEAVWCHWCHVMDATTYADAGVTAFLAKHFVAIKVDHDARPDLAQRYRAYGWPATIIFDANGQELLKRAGYIAPEEFLQLVQQLIANPQPINATAGARVAYATSPLLDPELRQRLKQKHLTSYDKQAGGLKLKKKFLDRGAVEYDLLLAGRGDMVAQKMAKQTLDAAMSLIDPAWGGAYQYSTHADWQHPHYEKIMWTQAGFIRLYSLAYSQFAEVKYKRAAQQVADYLIEFLAAENGGFYTSQDADLVPGQKAHGFFASSRQQRLALGMPRIDRNQYSLENGWAIEALALLAAVSGEQKYLVTAQSAANWVLANRRQRGGFYHGAGQKDLIFLGDNIAMTAAFTQLYASSAERRWLALAEQTLGFIDQHLRHPNAGFQTSTDSGSPLLVKNDIEENIALVRVANLLHHYSGRADIRQIAEYGMRFLASKQVALRRLEDSGILIAADELANAPAHYTVVGAKNNPGAAQLFELASKQRDWFKRVEWWDVNEGELPNHDVSYPQLAAPAGFICQQQRCSVPSFNANSYQQSITALQQIK